MAMIIDSKILNELTRQAKESPRLRVNYDLRDSENDSSQHILNAVEPGTIMAIHRHQNTSETVVCIRGQFEEYFYDDQGNITNVFNMVPGGVVLIIPKCQWHSLKSLESGTVLMSFKDGAYEPIKEEDIYRK